MDGTCRAVSLLRDRLLRFNRLLFSGALISVLACGFAPIVHADDPGSIGLGKPEVSRIAVGVGAPTLAPPGSGVRLHDAMSASRGLPVTSVGNASSYAPHRDVPLRPTEQTAQTAATTDLAVRPAGLPNNYRGTTFVPWLETLSLINGKFGGYAGSPGLHSQWSSEIDQWIAMIDAPGALGLR